LSIIIVHLNGGLGNQMFQYAAGRALSLRNGVPLKVDLSTFEASGRRRYELEAFRVQAAPATGADLDRFGVGAKIRARATNLLPRLLQMRAPRGEWPVYREPHFHFDPRGAALQAPHYLEGYWQSEKYFLEHADTLRREFIPRTPLEPENATLAAQIDAVNAVSLHVRRGDYISDPATRRYHGICSPDYYRSAVDYVGRRIEAPHLFLFSDDPGWTQQNLKFPLPTTVVTGNFPGRGYRDLQLMARCDHHIVANSSFSWWGAWLNAGSQKIVVAPSRWFDSAGHNTRDLIPESWVRI
jgi:hypothetical protein